MEARWDITPAGPGACHVMGHLRVPFSKPTVWKKFIEKGTYDSSLEAAQLFRRMVRM